MHLPQQRAETRGLPSALVQTGKASPSGVPLASSCTSPFNVASRARQGGQPQRKTTDRGGVKDRKVFPHSPGGWEVPDQVLADGAPAETSFPGLQMSPSCCVLSRKRQAQRKRELLHHIQDEGFCMLILELTTPCLALSR